MAQTVKHLPCSAGDPGSIPGLGRSPREGNGNPLQYSCLVKFHGLRSLVSYSPWGRKELDMTEQLHFHFYCDFRKKISLPYKQFLSSVVLLGNRPLELFHLTKLKPYTTEHFIFSTILLAPVNATLLSVSIADTNNQY